MADTREEPHPGEPVLASEGVEARGAVVVDLAGLGRWLGTQCVTSLAGVRCPSELAIRIISIILAHPAQPVKPAGVTGWGKGNWYYRAIKNKREAN